MFNADVWTYISQLECPREPIPVVQRHDYNKRSRRLGLQKTLVFRECRKSYGSWENSAFRFPSDMALGTYWVQYQSPNRWLFKSAAHTARHEPNQFKELLTRTLTHNVMILAKAA
jgi:hypothetical protein